MSSPGAHRRYQMERERREREALEQSERTRLKRAAAKHKYMIHPMPGAAQTPNLIGVPR